MNLLRKVGKAILPIVQWAAYKIVWIVGFAFAIAAFLMGLSPLLIDEAGREFVKNHWLLLLVVFVAVNAGAVAFLFLKWHLERRWPHVVYL